MPMQEPWGGISDIAAGSVVGLTMSVNTKKWLMHPGMSKMARYVLILARYYFSDYKRTQELVCNQLLQGPYSYV